MENTQPALGSNEGLSARSRLIAGGWKHRVCHVRSDYQNSAPAGTSGADGRQTVGCVTSERRDDYAGSQGEDRRLFRYSDQA